MTASNLKAASQFTELDGDPQFEKIHRSATQREIDATREALALSPEDPELHARPGNALMQIEDFEGAIGPHRRACELDESQLRCADYAIALQRAGLEDQARTVAEAAEGMAGSSEG